MKPTFAGLHGHSSLILNALMRLMLSITMGWPVHSQSQFPPLQLPMVFPLEHAKSNYQEPAGLARYTRNYYGAGGDELASIAYGNYGHQMQAAAAYGSTANGFVPYYNSRLQSEAEVDVREEPPQQQQQEQLQPQQGKIDYVINTGNYEEEPASYYHNYAYQPHYREDGERELQEQDRDAGVYARLKQRQTSTQPVKRQPSPPTKQEQDQQLQYSQSEMHIAHHSGLPAITTSVHHTPSSSKAVAGLPLAKHIEITKQVPVTHYQKQLVPFKQTIQLQIPRTMINAIPKPMPIKVPVSKTVAVPQFQEVKIPIEKIKPVPVERPMPFVVERRVPYRVEKAVATPVYYPYPIKVPVVRTVVHKQRPTHYAPGGWSSIGNHLLG